MARELDREIRKEHQELDEQVRKERRRVRSVAIRTTDVTRNLDLFLAFAVAGVLGNRFFLVVTGYPQLGNGTLHISHAIWGALMMATAIVVAVAFIAPAGRTVVAILGGAGFGWFVDELGKFITRDVNYFFRPTLALIYCVFIAMYLVFRSLERRGFRPEEGILNAFEALKAAALGRLDESERQRALGLLDATCHDHALTPKVRELLHHVATIPPPRPGWVTRTGRRLLRGYEAWTERRGFVVTVIAFFTVLALFDVAQVLSITLGRSGVHHFVQWATLVSSVVSLSFVIVGACLLPRNRLAAFRWFEASVLVAIFVTQVFLFANDQLGGVLDLAVTLAVWVGLRSVIGLEGAAARDADNPRPPGSAPLPTSPDPAPAGS
jgi:hypothetical protein